MALGAICLAVWIYLLAGRGRFWRCRERDADDPGLSRAAIRSGDVPLSDDVPFPDDEPFSEKAPFVVAVIPARDEAACIGDAVRSLVEQDYPGRLAVIVVDDSSSDGTGRIAAAAAPMRAGRTVTVLAGLPLPRGWAGKVWALRQGLAAAQTLRPDYLLLTDADIVHAADNVGRLVRRAGRGRMALVSLMAQLRCRSFAERMHVPAFVYFFQMLFPFAWVNSAKSGVAAAAGGCMLIRPDALVAIGGVDRIRNAVIDDCALAAELKKTGPIWLGLTKRVRSVRPYERLADVAAMISRSAYAQLRYSPVWLLAAAAALLIVFAAPPLLALFGTGLERLLGLAAWMLMAISFVPIARFYRCSPLWGVALPAIALAYLGYTFNSAYCHVRRRGGAWKGRVHIDLPSLP